MTPTVASDDFGRQAATDYFCQFLDGCVSRRVRGIMEFAEQVVIMPNDGGPYQGLPFSRDFQPYVELLYHEIDHGPWAMILAVGPSQSGKTFSCFVVPVTWIVSELKENLVAGIPDENMINDKWSVDIGPVFEAAPELKRLLPTRGPGSAGGRIKTAIKLSNGRQIRFMTKGGSDQSKAGFTSRKSVFTEIAGFSRAQTTSKEASTFQQIQARQKSASQYTDDGSVDVSRRIYAEGTVTDEDDLPWREFENSSQSRLLYECVHCRSWIRCEREDLFGWKGAKDELEAAEKAHFRCPSCHTAFTNDHREQMLRERKRLVHRGQSVDSTGTVAGPLPRTGTLWFRWSAWDNLFLKAADFGAEEWRASRKQRGTPEHDDAERQLCQQTWAIPYEPLLVDSRKLDPKAVAKRGQDETFPAGALPPDTEAFAVGVDPGLWEIWHCGVVGRNSGTMHTPIYGRDETRIKAADLKGRSKTERESHSKVAIANALLRVFDRLDVGFSQLGQAAVRHVDIGFIDASYYPDAVFDACRRYGEKTGDWFKYIPIYGRGKSAAEGRRYSLPTKTGPVVRSISETGLWHEEFNRARGMAQVIIDVDRTKLDVQAALRVPAGMPGALTLYHGTRRDHRRIASHFAAEVRRRYLENGEIKEEWKRKGANHLLDCAGYGLAGLDRERWFLPEIPHDEIPEIVTELKEIQTAVFGSGEESQVEPENAITRRLRELGEL